MLVIVDPDCRAKVTAAILPWLDGDLGAQVAERTVRYAPVDTGALAASVEHHLNGTTEVIASTGGAGGRWYAAYVEEGHRVFHRDTRIVGPEWVPGQHFMRAALFGGYPDRTSLTYLRADSRVTAVLKTWPWRPGSPGTPWGA